MVPDQKFNFLFHQFSSHKKLLTETLFLAIAR